MGHLKKFIYALSAYLIIVLVSPLILAFFIFGLIAKLLIYPPCLKLMIWVAKSLGNPEVARQLQTALELEAQQEFKIDESVQGEQDAKNESDPSSTSH